MSIQNNKPRDILTSLSYLIWSAFNNEIVLRLAVVFGGLLPATDYTGSLLANVLRDAVVSGEEAENIAEVDALTKEEGEGEGFTVFFSLSTLHSRQLSGVLAIKPERFLVESGE